MSSGLMNIGRGIVAVIVLALPLLAQALPSGSCTPAFPMAQGWLGADAAYSIPLPDGRDVWIFGDTLYGEQRAMAGDDPRMVRNSIGISTCEQNHWSLQYVIRRDSAGKPVDFFQSADSRHWYWALDGVYYKKELWVTLLCVRSSPKDSPGLGFETCGSDLARVSGLDRAAQLWKVSISPLVPDGTGSYPSAATAIYGKYLYIYSLTESGGRPEALTRIPLKRLSEAAASLEYFAADGSWKKGFNPKDAKAVMEHGPTEMTVRYHADLKKWLAVMVEPVFFSDKILVRTADSLEGPWSVGQVVYRIPEMNKQSPGYDPDTFCYAGKEHPELGTAGKLVITYVCNSFKPQKLISEPEIYLPRAVTIDKRDLTAK